MNRNVEVSSPRWHRVLAGTGLLATVTAGGLGVAAATAAEAQAASGTVHACYSKSTHALKFSKKASCPKGSKLVTWNKKGPQGAPGAKGAQGPQGAAAPVTAFANEKYRTRSGSTFSLASSSTPVASFIPASAGYFAVNGMADVVIDIGGSHEATGCWDQGGPANGHNYTPYGIGPETSGRYVAVPTGGIVYGSPATPIYERCYVSDALATFASAEVTGTHLTAAHATSAAKANAPAATLRAARPPKVSAQAQHKFNKK